MIWRNSNLLLMSTLLSSLFGGNLVAAATSSASGASSTPAIHTVTVGANGFSYNPNTTFANPGDTIVFEFLPTNHSVIRAEYTGSSACGSAGCNPCVPYELIHPGEAGFSSGNFLTQNDDPNSAPTWNLTVNDTSPVFFYCDAIDSCHPNGMVGVINPNETVSLDKQFQAAVNAPYELGPGQTFPAEGGGTMSNTPSSTQSSSASSSNNSGGTHLSGGAIAGIVIGGVIVVLLAAALFYFVGRSKSYHDIIHGKGSSAQGQGSQMGDLGPWSPAAPATPGQPQHSRFSGMTAYSQVGPSEGRFIGYNRDTGAPEFAQEAAESPQPLPGGFSPQMRPGGFVPNKHQSVELPGDAPAVAEKGPTEK